RTPRAIGICHTPAFTWRAPPPPWERPRRAIRPTDKGRSGSLAEAGHLAYRSVTRLSGTLHCGTPFAFGASKVERHMKLTVLFAAAAVAALTATTTAASAY